METLIKNPTFQNFQPLPGIGAGQLAADWTLDYDKSKRRPEARQAAADFDGAQQFFSTKALMDAWILQRIPVGVGKKGKIFVFGAQVALKSVNSGSGIGEYYVALGIDRWGETDPTRMTAHWLTPQHQANVPKWTNFEIRAPIEGDTVTVYVRAYNKYPVDGSLFIKSVYGHIVDDPCAGTQPQPEPEPLPGDDVLATIAQQLAVVQANQIAMMEKLDDKPDFDEFPGARA